jgi:hypothetical protein
MATISPAATASSANAAECKGEPETWQQSSASVPPCGRARRHTRVPQPDIRIPFLLPFKQLLPPDPLAVPAIPNLKPRRFRVRHVGAPLVLRNDPLKIIFARQPQGGRRELSRNPFARGRVLDEVGNPMRTGSPRYNIAPTQNVPVIRHDPIHTLDSGAVSFSTGVDPQPGSLKLES